MSEPQESATPPAAGPAQAPHPKLWRGLKIVLAAAVLAYFVAALLFAGLCYLVMPRVDSFRPRLEALVSRHTHATVTIGKLEAHWAGLEPALDIGTLTIRGKDGIALTVPHASAVFSWSSLLRLTPVLSSLVVDRPDLLIERHADGSLFIAGISVPNATSGDPTFSTWLLQQRAIVLHDGTLRWRDGQHDAPELVLSGIRAEVLNGYLTHRLALQAPADGTLFDGPLDFRARFKHNPFGVVGRPSNWHGTAYVSASAVDLPTLSRYATIHLETLAGRISNRIWVDFGGGHLHHARGTLDSEAVALRAADQPRLDIPVARVAWDLAIEAHRDYRLHLTNLHAELNQPPLADGTPVLRALSFDTLTARYRLPTVDRGLLLSVAGDRVDLGLLNEFVRGLPLPATFRGELSRYAPRGLIENYEISAERAKPANASQVEEERRNGTAPVIHYRFAGDLRGLSFAAQPPAPGLNEYGHPHVGAPGVENLWGHVDADEHRGDVTLDTVGAAVTVPGLFEEPRLPFDRLRGAAHWTIVTAPGTAQPARMDVRVPDLYVANADAAAHTTLHYMKTEADKGSLDLKSTFERAAVPRIPRYLPTSIGAQLRHYLAHALQAGQVKRGASIVVNGPLDTFPYSHAPRTGVFQIRAPFTGGQFEPTPQPLQYLSGGVPNVWPALTGIDGEFQISEQLLRFDISRGHYKRFAFAPVTGLIIDTAHPVNAPLVISGKGRGPLSDFVDYVAHSPLGVRSGDLGARLHTDGPADFALTLTFPQHTPHTHTSVDGSLTFDGDTLALDTLPPLTALRGRVQFTRETARAEQLTGRLLGGDWHARGTYAENGRYAFETNGHLGVESANWLNLQGTAAALLAHVSGSAPYRLDVQGTAHGGLPEVSAHADLSGLALDFPAPLGKSAGAPMPFDLTLAPTRGAEANGASDTATLRLGPLAARYLIDTPRGGPAQARCGAIAMPGGEAAPELPDLPAQGVQARLALPALDLDAWRQTLQRAAQAPAARAAAEQPARIDVNSFIPGQATLDVGALTLAGRHWDRVHLDAEHSGARWQARLEAAQASGTITWTPPGASNAGVLRARFARLAIPPAAASEGAGAAAEHAAGTTAAARTDGSGAAPGKDRAPAASPGALPPSAGMTAASPAASAGASSASVTALSPAQTASASKLPLPARQTAGRESLPEIDIVADQLSVAGRDLGRLEVAAHNRDSHAGGAAAPLGSPVWQLDRLTLDNPAAHFSASGQWRAPDAAQPAPGGMIPATPRHTALDFKLAVDDAGALLERAGMPRTVAGGHGTLSGKVDWLGDPSAPDYPSLNGEVALDLHDGKILTMESGAANLLSVLSLQSLARMLSLDFHMLSASGVPFQDVEGHGKIGAGVLQLQDFSVNATPAKVALTGSVDLGRNTQDLRAHVMPKIGAGTAALATAVINPLLGLGVLAADVALSQTLSHAFAFDYAITGSWAHPRIERRGSDQSKMNHTPAAASP